MLKLSSVFPKDINEHTYDAYFIALEKWKIEAIEKAALYFLKTETFFPLPTTFNDRLGGMEGCIRPKEITNEAGEVKYIVDSTFLETTLALPTPTVKELLAEAKKHTQ